MTLRPRDVRIPVLIMIWLALASGAGAAGGRVMDATVPSPSLRVPYRSARVYLPPSYDAAPGRRYPVLYLLHGAPGDRTDWFTKGALRETLDVLIATHRIPEVIAIAPDGKGPGRSGRSLWINNWDGSARLGDFLARDVVAWADRALRTKPDARHRTLMGISDGGDAALNVMLRRPDVFGGCAGLSGRYHPHSAERYENVVGPPAVRDSVLRSASALLLPDETLRRVRGHRIYFDSGVIDGAANDCWRLHRRFDALGVPHESHLYFGWHDWPWWRDRESVALQWVLREPAR